MNSLNKAEFGPNICHVFNAFIIISVLCVSTKWLSLEIKLNKESFENSRNQIEISAKRTHSAKELLEQGYRTKKIFVIKVTKKNGNYVNRI